jgi:hypothetical protein
MIYWLLWLIITGIYCNISVFLYYIASTIKFFKNYKLPLSCILTRVRLSYTEYINSVQDIVQKFKEEKGVITNDHEKKLEELKERHEKEKKYLLEEHRKQLTEGMLYLDRI